MAKHDRRKRSSQPRSSRTVSIQVPLPVLGVLKGVREAFHGLCIKTGMQVLEAMMEGDREDLCGPKGCHQVERPAWRGGSVASQVTLGGRQVAVPRLRVRSDDGEEPLPSPDGRRPPTRWTSIRWPRSPPGCRRGGMRVRWTRRRPRWRSGGRRAARCLGGSWRCRPSACGRFSAGRWTSWTCVWSASTARSSGTIAWWSRWGSTRRAASTCWDCAKGPPRRRSSPAACSAIWSRAACRRTGH